MLLAAVLGLGLGVPLLFAEDGDQAEALPRTRDVLHVYGVFSPPQPAHAMYMVHGAGVARCVCRYIAIAIVEQSGTRAGFKQSK